MLTCDYTLSFNDGTSFDEVALVPDGFNLNFEFDVELDTFCTSNNSGSTTNLGSETVTHVLHNSQPVLFTEWIESGVFIGAGSPYTGVNVLPAYEMTLDASDGGTITLDLVGATFSGNPPTTFAALNSAIVTACLLYTSPSPRDRTRSRMPSSA